MKVILIATGFAVLTTMGAACPSGSDTPADASPSALGAKAASVEAMDPSAAPADVDPALPGLQGDAKLMALLTAAYDARGDGYVPRTHHKTAEGRARFVNRLILETSPYLLQHAHNPVNWYPWGDAAFERARRDGKPVLMSIGYSTCHWCHVMERESFEDTEIAAYINQHFIAVKVDREERPDVDDIYMKAVNMLTGRGGWPMTTVLTPAREPFFGGTYFAARDGDRGSRKGFFTILKELKARYDNDRDGVVAEAKRISQRIAASAVPARPGDVPGEHALSQAARSLAGRFDPVWGGFGRAPKFPRPVTLELLLRYHRRTGDGQALAIVTRTLARMAAGGMHDQVGGGFHRYSVDARWLVPHFEKMLYDNAQLSDIYLEAYQATGQRRWADVARKTLDYVAREMTAPHGAFYSATDADSPAPGGHDEEGWFFTWTPGEIDQVLDAESARVVKRYHGVSEGGNFEGRSILHLPASHQDAAAALAMTPEALEALLEGAHAKLYEHRAKRPPPIRDDKILTAWNGLMIGAFARGALVLGEQGYATRAAKAARFILSALRRGDGRLMRTHMDGRARFTAYLQDYAYLIDGLLDLYEVTAELHWLNEAIALQGRLDAHYLDATGGAYFTTAADAEALLARAKPGYDGAEPSGNSVALMNLLRLTELTGDRSYRARAEKGFAAFSRNLGRGSTGLPKMLSALDFYLDRARQVIIVGNQAGDPVAAALLDRFRTTFLPNRVLVRAERPSDVPALARVVPAMQGKTAMKGAATAYVCEQGRCEQPTSDPEVFQQQLNKVARPLLVNGAAPTALAPVEPEAEPAPWHYDASTDQHWHPEHRHWHKGKPPRPHER